MGGKLFESIDGFKHALKKLPPQLGEGTLDLLQTDHDRLSAARESLQKWIDETERRREEKTRKVRAMRSNPA
jgi:hypothetical protein